MKAVIIQPPLVQLNTAYPSGVYLKSFFTSQNVDARWYDLSIELFEEIFSREGLTLLFEKTKTVALNKSDEASLAGDEGTCMALRRYVSESDRWIRWIPTITAILRDGSSSSGRELCHQFIFSPFAPRGMRMERFLEQLEREPSTDDARFLATMALADLADYITAVFDSEFSLVRYAESLTVNETSFSQIVKGIDSPVLKTYYQKVLERNFSQIEVTENQDEKILVCISVPFAGTFTPALYTARYLKQKYGNKIYICLGGGFVNTELRDVQDAQVFDFVDAFSYDRGYGSYKALLEKKLNPSGDEPIYKLRFSDAEKIIPQKEADKELMLFEDQMTQQVIPDFSDIDFSKYPRLLDDTNPMQRLWSDGSWMKAYLAHGCYWHKCDFCDVTLDYVAGYHQTKIESLYDGLYEQAKKNGIWGIHFVDEAMPPSAMCKFAQLNAAGENQFSYWGNVRFEKNFTYDLAAFLAYGGLIGVSAGIEIATGTGLDNIHKGTSLENIIAACCAFKEAGILVHAYMIYGYWNQNDQDTINSMETLRQFYKAGLLDSSFWHKFVLTRHSRIYSEYQNGMHPNLKPIEPKDAGIFAKNGLHFEGERKSEKFGDGLNQALQAWMHGEALDRKVGKWFNFKTPEPTIPSNLIESAIEKYESQKEAAFQKPIDLNRTWWLGGQVNLVDGNRKINWLYMQDLFEEKAYIKADQFAPFQNALNHLSPSNRDTQPMEQLLKENPAVEKTLKALRGAGLVCV